MQKLYLYRITNTLNGKAYIGWSKDYLKRWEAHRRGGRCGARNAIHLAIAKYGIEAFTFEVLEEFEGGVKEAHAKEIAYIAAHGTFTPGGYNMTRGGDGAVDLGKLSATAAAAWKSRDPEGYLEMCRQRGLASAKTRGSAAHSESAKRMWANRSPEAREAFRKKMLAREAGYSEEYKRERGRKAHEKFTPEERSRRAAHASASRTAEALERCVAGIRASRARLPKEIFAEAGRKSVESRMRNTTPEQRRASALKTWETRRKRALEKAQKPPE